MSGVLSCVFHLNLWEIMEQRSSYGYGWLHILCVYTLPVKIHCILFRYRMRLSFLFSQASVEVLGLEVDFIFPLSQEKEGQQQEQTHQNLLDGSTGCP